MAYEGRRSGLVQRGRYDSPFFRSKFQVPSTPKHFVRRPRLTSLLDDLAEYPLTALVAPAGAGKTALAADWVRHTDRRSAWLALDDSDGDPQQLLIALAAALDDLVPGCAESTAAALRPSDDPDEGVRVLVEALDEDVAPAVLVIDDVHVLDGHVEASAGLSSFIEHRPSWLALLLVSRRQLTLPVDRLRASGSLADLTFETLRFSEDEAMELLTGLCPATAPERLPTIAEWAGGWAAALQLAALANRSQQAPQVPEPREENLAPPGSNRLVDGYLWHEVLRAEAPETIDLLLAVSVVDRVNYPLAEALTGRTDAGDILAEAESRGLFVTALESGGWFEVHELVRDQLLAELERRWPDRLREYHARAARWFETADNSLSALEHWIAAGMPREALRTLAELAVELYDDGQGAVIRKVVGAIPPDFSDADTAALIDFAWCQLLVDKDAFELALAAADAASSSSENDRLLILRAAAALASGDWHRSGDLARTVLTASGDGVWLDTLGRFAWSLVAHDITLGERWSEEAAEVVQVRVGVRNDARRALALEGTRALGLALSGHPLDAVTTVAGVRQTAEAARMSSLRVEVELAEAIATRELGDRDRARELLEPLALQPAYPQVYVQVLAQLELVALQLSTGDLDAAEAAFRLASETCAGSHGGLDATNVLAHHGVSLGLACRDLTGARGWLDRSEDPFWHPLDEARILLAQHKVPEAVESLALAVPRSARQQVTGHLLTARALLDADRGTAEKEAAAAVEIAAGHGMLETVSCEGAELMDLLELAAWRVPEGWMQRLRRTVAGAADLRSPPGALVEELTSRERDVLRLLPSRLTVREIAAELFVSHNTLKFHLRVIYQKLGVNSRAEAVEAARAAGLLRRT